MSVDLEGGDLKGAYVYGVVDHFRVHLVGVDITGVDIMGDGLMGVDLMGLSHGYSPQNLDFLAYIKNTAILPRRTTAKITARRTKSSAVVRILHLHVVIIPPTIVSFTPANVFRTHFFSSWDQNLPQRDKSCWN